MSCRKDKPITLWMIQLAAEDGGRHFNVFVVDADREIAEATAEEALKADGWQTVQVLRSAITDESRLASRNPVLGKAAVAARELGWAIVRYSDDSLPLLRTVIN